MSLTAKDLAEITRLLEDSNFDELELEIDGMKIHLRRSAAVRAPASSDVAAPKHVPADSPATPTASDPRLVEVRAPLLGTFYRAPKPGAAPYVEPGANVEPESVIGIIEVMKLMNTVRAGTRGVVREILARDGALVEYGQALLRIDPAGPA